MSINTGKTLVLLGVFTLGQEAFATAQVNHEQRIQVGDVALSVGVGLLNGQSEEKAYDVASGGEKISQLNWDIKQVPTLHLGLRYSPLDWLSLDVSGWSRMSEGNSHMKDFDWLGDEDENWTHYSDHPDTRLKTAWQAEFAATAWALKRDDLALGFMAGYQRSRFAWEAKGGSYLYSSDHGYRDISGNFPSAQKVISYQQRHDAPYLGLVGLYTLHNWSLESRFKHSQWVKARDFDSHPLRDLTFTRNNGNKGRMQSLAVAVSYRFSPQFSVKAGIDHQVYSEAKGSTLVKHTPSGASRRYEGKAGGQSNRTTLSTFAVAYQF